MHEVKAKSKQVNLARLQQALGKGSTLLFKEGNYRHDYEGGVYEFELYRRSENRQYMKKRGNDTIYWYDCSKGGKSIKDLKSSRQKKVVLGILCDQLSVQYSDHSKVEYYNADSISIDPQWFAEFRRNDQYKTDSIGRSIFLRSELEYSAFSIVLEATKVQREPVNMDVFEISSNAILLELE